METMRRSRKQVRGETTITTISNSLHLLPLLLCFLLLTILTPRNSVAADGTPAPTDPATPAPVVNGSEVTEGGGAGGGGGGEEGTLVNETQYEIFSDVTNFVDGINGWDFMGSWAKYDLSVLSEAQRPLPLVPDEDQGVFICQTSDIPSTLQKGFPALHNATFALTYYAKADDGELQMTGEVVGAGGEIEALFNQSLPGEGSGHAAGTWGTDNFTLPLLAAMGNFELRVGVRHSASGVWAAAEMRVEGMTGPPLPPTTPAPPILPPVNVTTNSSNLNETTTTTTTTTAPPVNGTTAAPPNTTATSTTTTTTAAEEEEEDLSRLESVAQAIWDAFYVFLALFCACLVALVALIVHGRCKDDEPPPAVATYNPRTASYRMDKVYDNPSYDNNAV